MADLTKDMRLESLLREALVSEVAGLPMNVTPAKVMERAAVGRRASAPRGIRGLLGTRPTIDLRQLAVAAFGLAALALAAVLVGNLVMNQRGLIGPPVTTPAPTVEASPSASPTAPAPTVEASPSASPSATASTHLPTSLADWSLVLVDTPSVTGGITSVAAGPLGLVAVTGHDGNNQRRVLFSADGRDWAAADVRPSGEYVSVVATERGFLMTSSEEGAFASADGLEWQQVAENWTGNPDTGGSIVTNAAAGGPGYVAVGNNNTIWHSTDGTEWLPAAVPARPQGPSGPDLTVDMVDVAAVGDHVVATGYLIGGASDHDFVLTSSDGQTWSTALESLGDGAGVARLAAGPNGFLVISGPLDGFAQSTIWGSVDGQVWQEVGRYNFGPGSLIRGLAATSSGYVAVGGLRNGCDFCPIQPMLWTSPDGRSWSPPESGEPLNLHEPGGSTFNSVAPYGSGFVVGGEREGQAAVWLSGSDTS